MPFPSIPALHTRRAFEDGLRDALEDIEQRLRSYPTDPTYLALSRQLAAIAGWTAGGAALAA